MSNPVLLPPFSPLEYRAIGLVRGRYLPSQNKITRGTLLTHDGTVMSANLTDNAGWLTKVQPELLLDEERVWVAWPRTQDNHLHMQLKTMRLPVEGQTIDDIQGVDYFSVRGEIVSQDSHTGTITVRIHRNIIPPDKALRKKYQPFTLGIEGFLPGNVNGQFWDLDVCREGNKLILEDATFIAQVVFDLPPVAEPKKSKKKKGGKPPEKKSSPRQMPAQPGAEIPPYEPPPNLFKKKKKL
jgi:hypothetical protein